jgi:hypothetical protein
MSNGKHASVKSGVEPISKHLACDGRRIWWTYGGSHHFACSHQMHAIDPRDAELKILLVLAITAGRDNGVN